MHPSPSSFEIDAVPIIHKIDVSIHWIAVHPQAFACVSSRSLLVQQGHLDYYHDNN